MTNLLHQDDYSPSVFQLSDELVKRYANGREARYEMLAQILATYDNGQSPHAVFDALVPEVLRQNGVADDKHPETLEYLKTKTQIGTILDTLEASRISGKHTARLAANAVSKPLEVG